MILDFNIQKNIIYDNVILGDLSNKSDLHACSSFTLLPTNLTYRLPPQLKTLMVNMNDIPTYLMST